MTETTASRLIRRHEKDIIDLSLDLANNCAASYRKAKLEVGKMWNRPLFRTIRVQDEVDELEHGHAHSHLSRGRTDRVGEFNLPRIVAASRRPPGQLLNVDANLLPYLSRGRHELVMAEDT